MTNRDLPVRNSRGRRLHRPHTALSLHYILTFYGDESDLEPQRMMGSVVRTLEATPVLTRQMIEATIADPQLSYLATSDLAQAVETVKITSQSASLEELSKLWSIFFQVPYTLALLYQASAVIIESQMSAESGLPVRERNLYVVPFRQPVIDRVLSRTGVDEPVRANQPILWNHILVLAGKRLRGEVTRVRVGGVEVAPSRVGDEGIELPLTSPPFPAEGLPAGVVAAQVVQLRNMGTPAVPHRGEESNVAAFVLRPNILNIAVANVQGGGNTRSGDITLTVEPHIFPRQRLRLLLNQKGVADPRAYSFPVSPPQNPTNSLTVSVENVAAGSYLVRLQVDGAESPLIIDDDPTSPTFNQYIGPEVTLP
ncbi:MAG: DUF4255 domain-containing protein [Calditrichaeota bacterium]|nr:MAG: DUF4255 domain-containing protein [Calditrichota bacterium]